MTDQLLVKGPRHRLDGAAIVMRGDDIDTDRIIPARFLRTITFAGLGEHVFGDDRLAMHLKGALHPFDKPESRRARILIVNKNFGCGSSREHAAQALRRWGIDAIVGESFGEIFASNCVAIGVPCLRVSREVVGLLQEAAQGDSNRSFIIDLEEKMIRSGNLSAPIHLPEGARVQFTNDSWDATSVLLESGSTIERAASRLPYVTNWAVRK